MRQEPVGRDDAQAAHRWVSASHGNDAAASRTERLNPRDCMQLRDFVRDGARDNHCGQLAR